MKTSTHFLPQALIFSLLIILGMAACDIYSGDGGDEEFLSQTRIIDVLVEPDTVAPGDTASFTCIIKDSLDTRFKFYWGVEVGEVIGGELVDKENSIYKSEENTIQWIATSQNSVVYFQVTANNKSKDSVGVRQGFSIVVEE